jgi:hypothetical protein
VLVRGHAGSIDKVDEEESAADVEVKSGTRLARVLLSRLGLKKLPADVADPTVQLTKVGQGFRDNAHTVHTWLQQWGSRSVLLESL